MELTVLLPDPGVHRARGGAGRSCCAGPAGSWPGRASSRGSGATSRTSPAGSRPSLGGAIGQIDAVRRRQIGPDTISDTIAAATDAVERYARGGQAPSTAPATAQQIRADLVAELERAQSCARHGRARDDHPRDGAARAARARGPDGDQARLPEPHPRPRGDRPSRRSRRRISRSPKAPQKAGRWSA